MKIIKILVPLLIIAVYIVCYIFPVKFFYTYNDFDITPYTPRTTQLIQISKSFFLFPGPKFIWLERTEKGYIAFSKFNASGKEKPVFTLSTEEVIRSKQ